MKTSYKLGLAIITSMFLITLILVPRIIGLDLFVTVDEPIWLIGSGNFYYALGQRDFGMTYVANHPAVPTMWVITAAYIMYFPEFRGQGQGYVWTYRNFDQLFQKFHKRPLELLKLSRIIYVIINSLLLLIVFLLLRLLHGDLIAWVSTLLIAFDPYFLGHSRVLNHQAMMSLFLLITLLTAMLFFERKPHWFLWVALSISAGLALITIIPSIILIPVVGLMLLVNTIDQWKKQNHARLIFDYFKSMAVFCIIIGITFVVIWPGMWVEPGKMLNLVLGNAVSYAFQGASLGVTSELNPSNFGLDFSGIYPYLASLMWRTTPLTWLGVLFAGIGLFTKNNLHFSPSMKQSVAYFALVAALFIVIFGIAKGRNSQHYIIPSYVCLEVLAAIGIVGGIRWLRARIKIINRSWVEAGLITCVLCFQFTSGISQFPYYYTYVSPLLRYFNAINPNSGYGEGLEKAGKYLSQKPNARDLFSVSWYGYGPFSYFFSGHTIHMPPTVIMEPQLLENIRKSDYLVVYDINQKRTHRPSLLMDALTGVSPEKIIKINGLDYVSIYRVSDLPSSLFKSLNR